MLKKAPLAFCLVLLLVCSCKKAEETKTYSISIYGTDNCGITTAFRNACISSGLEFQYFNVDISTENKNKMWEVVHQFSLGSGGKVLYPVVYVQKNTETFGFERPNIDDIKKLLEK
jgi:hypothetical protein